MANKINIGLIGYGNVGKNLYALIKKNRENIFKYAGIDLEISHLGLRREYADLSGEDIKISSDILEVAKDPSLNIVVELIGGVNDAYHFSFLALKNKKHLITANKALISHKGDELFRLARENNVNIFFEGAVGGAIPIVQLVSDSFPMCGITEISGIINGTGNFILTQMEKMGATFEQALNNAQELGYAEKNPCEDIEGIDLSHKIKILAAFAFSTPIESIEVTTTGIKHIDIDDINIAKSYGHKIKHLATARLDSQELSLFVRPVMVSNSNILAQIDGANNAIVVKTNHGGNLAFLGKGAGGEATASVVISDIIKAVKNRNLSRDKEFKNTYKKGNKLTQSYFLRVDVPEGHDLISLRQILHDQGIPIKMLEFKMSQSEMEFHLMTGPLSSNRWEDFIEIFKTKCPQTKKFKVLPLES